MKYERFVKAKKFAEQHVAPLVKEAGYQNKAFNIEHCGDIVDAAVCKKCGTRHFKGFFNCKERLCPQCQIKRSCVLLAKFFPVIADLIKKKWTIHFLNFTIVAGDDLKKQLDIINKAQRHLLNKNHEITAYFNYLFPAGIKSIEIKRGELSGQWHVHLHMIVAKAPENKTRDYDWIKTAWNQSVCTILNCPKTEKQGSIDISQVKSFKNKTLLKKLHECFKYSVKFSTFDNAADIREVIEALHNRRLLSSWGLFYDILNEAEKKAEEISFLEAERMICTVCGSKAFEEIHMLWNKDLQLKDFNKSEDFYD